MRQTNSVVETDTQSETNTDTDSDSDTALAYEYAQLTTDRLDGYQTFETLQTLTRAITDSQAYARHDPIVLRFDGTDYGVAKLSATDLDPTALEPTQKLIDARTITSRLQDDPDRPARTTVVIDAGPTNATRALCNHLNTKTALSPAGADEWTIDAGLFYHWVRTALAVDHELIVLTTPQLLSKTAEWPRELAATL